MFFHVSYTDQWMDLSTKGHLGFFFRVLELALKVMEETVSASNREICQKEDITGRWQDNSHSVFPLPAVFES